MRVTDFVFNLIDRLTPMNDVDKAELRREANSDYLKWRQKGDDGDKSIPTRIVKYLEHWTSRTGLAILYIWILPWLTERLNPEPDFEEFDDDDEDDEEDDD